MRWAGPIEISATEIFFALVILTLMALALPLLAGVVAVLLYRRRTPEAERTRRKATITFFQTAALALLAQLVLGAIIGGIQELIG